MIISVTVCLMYPVFNKISFNGKRGIKYTYFKLKTFSTCFSTSRTFV